MDTKSKLDTLWKKGVGEMKNLASKADQAASRLAERSAATAPNPVPGAHERGDASGAEDISREDLLQLTMKLSKRLKSSESSNAALTKEARRFMLERDALRKAVSAEVLGRPGALEDVPLREGAGSSSEPSAALLDALRARAAGGGTGDGAPDGATATLKTALEAALAGRDGLATKLRAAEASLAESRRSFEDQVVALRLQLKSAASGRASAETLAELAAKDATIAELAAARDASADAKATLAAALAEERALAERVSGERQRADNRHATRTAKLAAAEKERDDALRRLGALEGEAAALRAAAAAADAARAAAADDAATAAAAAAAAACAEAAAASATSAVHATTVALGAVARAEAAAKASRDVADARTKAESDHAKRSSLARSIMAEKDAKLRDLAAAVARLEADLSCGGHENRAFVEIANRQAAREGAHAVDLEAAKVATKRLQTAIRSRDAEMADLASELLAAHAALDERAAPGDGPNLEYAKNVVVQYMSLVPGSSEHASLVPVLATVLDFSDDDVAALRAAARKHDDDFRRNAPWFGPAPPPSPLLTLATLRAPKPRKPLREAPG